MNPSTSPEQITLLLSAAQGPSGQHVNTTNSAVRCTHRPTGLPVVAQASRSQHANKKAAHAGVLEKLKQAHQALEGQANQAIWQQHLQLERGNAVQVFFGDGFKASL